MVSNFFMRDFCPKLKMLNFRTLRKTKTKFKILVPAFVEGIMLIRIKKISSLKTLEEVRIGDFLRIFENFKLINHNWKIYRKKKVSELHFMLAYQISED